MKTTEKEQSGKREIGKAETEHPRKLVGIGELRPDPEQPRKTFEEGALKGLAESIKEQGIIQDLIVSYRAGVKVHAPDLVEKSWQAVDGAGRVVASGNEGQVRAFAKGKEEPWYLIVDGERRWRAAQLAGLKMVPVAVRQVDEKAKLALQVVANQQREALSALEEAAAYRKEIDSGRHTAESLYKALGISRGTLFSRLALNRLHEPVRKALEAGKISVSVAGLVTMVPDKKRQEDLVKVLTDEESWQYPWSFREVQQEVEETYCKSLKNAPFGVKKAYPGEFKDEAGTVNLLMRGACQECRYRSGNIEGVECGNANVCTQPKCFEAKSAAAWTERSIKAQSAGQRVIDAAQWAKVRGSYVFESEEEYIGGEQQTWKDAMGRKGKDIERVLAQTPLGIKEVIPLKAAEEAAKANGVKLQTYSGNSAKEWEQEQRARRARKEKMESVCDLALSTLVLKASRPVKEINAAFLKDLVELALHRTDVDALVRQRPQMRQAKGNAPMDKALDYARRVIHPAEENLVGLLVNCLVRSELTWEGELNEEFKQACKMFGVDLKAVEKGMETKAVTLAEIKAKDKKKAKTPPPKAKG